MAQTTGGMSMRNAVVEISTDGGTTWVDVSGFANEINPDPGERASGSANTFFGDTPITTGGKLGPSNLTLKVTYSEVTGEYLTLYDAYKNGTAVSVRWSPKGAASGDLRWFMNDAIVTKAFAPGGAADSGDPILGEVNFFGAAIDYETIV